MRSWLTLALALTALASAACRNDHPRPRQPDPSTPNPPTVGVIDIPRDGTMVGPVITVAGWAADESGVAWVRLYLDDQIVDEIPLTIPRQDVANAFPRFAHPGDVYGWEATVDLGTKVGYCFIRAEALDGRGGLTRFATISVDVRP